MSEESKGFVTLAIADNFSFLLSTFQVDHGAHEPQEDLNQFDRRINDDVALEWSFQLKKLKRVESYGFQIHFSFSDILFSSPELKVPSHPLAEHLVLQSCTGTFLEALLVLVSLPLFNICR